MTDEREIRELLCEIARLAYARRLLDSAGGNLSARCGERILCTPRFAGSRRRWQLVPQDILSLDLAGNRLEGAGDLSRETKMHLAIYGEFPHAGGVCHAHPLHVLPFAHLRIPVPPASEQTEKYGVIPLCREAPAHSSELATAVVEALRPQVTGVLGHAIACIIPNHGITVAGRDLADAYDALERIDLSCSTLISAAALRLAPGMS